MISQKKAELEEAEAELNELKEKGSVLRVSFFLNSASDTAYVRIYEADGEFGGGEGKSLLEAIRAAKKNVEDIRELRKRAKKGREGGREALDKLFDGT